MKKVLFLPLLVLSLSLLAERIEPLPFGDMEQWTVRYIKESKLLGGQTKTLYCLAPTDTIRENIPYIFGQNGNPWATSNAYANVVGIEKAAGTMKPEKREDGGTCCRLDVDMLGVRVMGIIDIQVLVSGTLFTGRNIEPITTAADPYQNIDFGVPFTGRPTALMLDYKCVVEQESWYWFAKGTAKPKKREFENGEIDEAEAYIYLQHRWEDEKGKIHSIRVGTGYERFSKTQTEWVNAHRIPIHYGDITGEPYYKDYMGLNNDPETAFHARNSKGENVIISEDGWAEPGTEPTHMMIHILSSCGKAFYGGVGNTVWLDNVQVVM